MATVEEIARRIVAREGGWVDDPDDPGGATMRGVTLGTLRRLGLDLDGDGDSDRSDLRRIGPDDAVEIYVTHYFRRPGIDRLPRPLWPTVFDMYVNAGANAVRVLQRLFNDMGIACAVDGVIGPQTVACAGLALERAPDHLVDAYGIARRNYYYALADARPASRKFARRRDGGKGGWILRAEEFISPRFHLSEAQHAERVAAWG